MGERDELGTLMRYNQVSVRAGSPCSRGPEFPASGSLWRIAHDVASPRAVTPKRNGVCGEGWIRRDIDAQRQGKEEIERANDTLHTSQSDSSGLPCPSCPHRESANCLCKTCARIYGIVVLLLVLDLPQHWLPCHFACPCPFPSVSRQFWLILLILLPSPEPLSWWQLWFPMSSQDCGRCF